MARLELVAPHIPPPIADPSDAALLAAARVLKSLDSELRTLRLARDRHRALAWVAQHVLIRGESMTIASDGALEKLEELLTFSSHG